jgi:hypothetical protein
MTMFADLIKQCRGDHEHQQIIGSARGHGSRAVLSQVYPWTFFRSWPPSCPRS